MKTYESNSAPAPTAPATAAKPTPQEKKGRTILRGRFKSIGEILTVFVAISFPIFAWALALIVYYVPQFTLRLELWDVIGTLSYILAYALLESLMVFTIVMVILMLLPKRFFGPKTIPLTAAIVGLTTALVIFINATQVDRSLMRGRYVEPLIGFAVYAVSLVVAIFVIRRSDRLARLITGLLDRLLPLGLLYTFIGLVSVIIVAIRNFAG